MIRLTCLDGSEMYVNPDLIEIVNETPDTHITLSNGNRYLVREPARVVIARIVSFRGRVLRRGAPGARPKYLARNENQKYNPRRLT